MNWRTKLRCFLNKTGFGLLSFGQRISLDRRCSTILRSSNCKPQLAFCQNRELSLLAVHVIGRRGHCKNRQSQKPCDKSVESERAVLKDHSSLHGKLFPAGFAVPNTARNFKQLAFSICISTASNAPRPILEVV